MMRTAILAAALLLQARPQAAEPQPQPQPPTDRCTSRGIRYHHFGGQVECIRGCPCQAGCNKHPESPGWYCRCPC